MRERCNCKFTNSLENKRVSVKKNIFFRIEKNRFDMLIYRFANQCFSDFFIIFAIAKLLG